MKVDENGMCTLSEEDCSYHSCNTKKKICKCYHAERNFIGKIGVCWGTKECEACSCGGDESKCDFYEEKRKKATPKITNADRIRAMTDEELAERFASACPPKDATNRCCLYYFQESNGCKDCWLDWLKQEVDNDVG